MSTTIARKSDLLTLLAALSRQLRETHLRAASLREILRGMTYLGENASAARALELCAQILTPSATGLTTARRAERKRPRSVRLIADEAPLEGFASAECSRDEHSGCTNDWCECECHDLEEAA